MSPHLLNDPEEHKTSIEAGRAWAWLKKTTERTLPEWLKVGVGFRTGRAWAMRRAGTNQPMGRGYNEAFGRWLKEYRLDDIDQADRSNLFKLMDSPAILEWRNTLPDEQRGKLNHPTTILRAYARTATRTDERGDKEPSPAKKTSAELAAALQRIHALEIENDRLKAHAQELEAARELAAQAAPDTQAEIALASDTRAEIAAAFTPEFPKYPPSCRGTEDITAKVIGDWLERELLDDRISPFSLQMIGTSAQYTAKLWMPKHGRGRLKKKMTDAEAKRVHDMRRPKLLIDLPQALDALVDHMKDSPEGKFGETALPIVMAAKPTFTQMDLREMAKAMGDLAGCWKSRDKRTGMTDATESTDREEP